jgi:acyl carrier protein
MQDGIEREIRDVVVRDILEDPSSVPGGDIPLLSGLIDSFGLMTLLGFIEDQYGVAIGNDEIVKRNFESVSVLAGFVERKLRERDGTGPDRSEESPLVGRAES